ncbi:MAG TPA: bifunctional lysylphosphatidylglycerol flippase/synthetase MprF [Longimicrobium sp.]|jgi:phosphatidylglycerol lysyltransferase
MNHLRRWGPAVLGLLLFAAAGYVLHQQLREVSYREVRATLGSLPRTALLASVLICAVNYFLLTGFDLLGFYYIGRKVPWWKVSIASFTGYAISNSVGFALISGTSVRYRFYSRWGLTAGEISRIVLFYFGTFWLGLLVLGGWSLALDPHPTLSAGLDVTARIVGWALLASAAIYFGVSVVWRRPIRFMRWTFSLPPARIVALQFILSTIDWALAAGIFYVLIPHSQLSFADFMSAFLAAQMIGLLSHVPGGAGVFEGTMAVLLGGYLTPEQLLSSLVLYRLVYYVGPLGVALMILVADEVRQRRHYFARWTSTFGALSLQLAPKVLAAFTFVGGGVLLFSGATPGEEERVYALTRVLPLAVVEASYFLGSVVGVGLLIVSNGVARRLDLAYYLAAAGLAAGIAASILKGGDYEEASLLAFVLVGLILSRPAFDRKAEFFDARFNPGWILAMVAVVGASVWLAFFAFSHVEYSSELWWRFAANQDAPRALRASVGATVAIMAFGVFRLLRPAPPEIVPPTGEELAAAAAAIERQPSTVPYLVYLHDKSLLFNEDRSAFLMYGVQGRTWVAMGDPVGEHREATELIRRFFGRCDDFGGIPVFYQVRKERLHQYADFGLTFVKLGEEAYVELPSFRVDGAEGKPFRLALNRFARSGMTFRVVPVREVPALLPQLAEVSAAWLAHKRASEKGFSLGFFSPEYVLRFPVAVVEEAGRVVAFATVWPGPGGQELSVDLMRYRADAPRSVMEVLLLHLILWGKEAGFQRFNLGMAPLSGLELSAVAPMWTRVGHFLFEQGEPFYNFQGLRSYKEKFHPVWEPRYLAYPGGLALARVMADVSALIAGGYRGIFARRGRAGE